MQHVETEEDLDQKTYPLYTISRSTCKAKKKTEHVQPMRKKKEKRAMHVMPPASSDQASKNVNGQLTVVTTVVSQTAKNEKGSTKAATSVNGLIA
jgi:hypothetical protein